MDLQSARANHGKLLGAALAFGSRPRKRAVSQRTAGKVDSLSKINDYLTISSAIPANKRSEDPPPHAVLESEREVATYLEERGVVESDAAVTKLSGGVSANVWLVVDRTRRLVVKQPLLRLNVSELWECTPQRARIEIDALRYVGALTPNSVPKIVNEDHQRCLFVMTAASEKHCVWREELLAGAIDPDIGAEIGTILATWHSRTADDRYIRIRFGDLTVFTALRLEPFHRTVARRCPDLLETIQSRVDELELDRRCLVHGDFSPKNILIGREESWILDMEVAHFGNPVFDVASLLHHLVLKSIHVPSRKNKLRQCGDHFLDAYRCEFGVPASIDESGLSAHVGCLVLARIHGLSPIPYLDVEGRRTAEALGRRLLLEAPRPIDAIWDT